MLSLIRSIILLGFLFISGVLLGAIYTPELLVYADDILQIRDIDKHDMKRKNQEHNIKKVRSRYIV